MVCACRDLSSDAMEGRGAGTPGHERAVRYVEGELRRLGLQPAGLTGFQQPIAFTESRIDYAASSAKLTIGGAVTPVPMPSMAVISLRRPWFRRSTLR